MGAAAYRRGSEVIGRQIENEYMERVGRSKANVALLARAEEDIAIFDQFVSNAKELYVDCCYAESANGFVRHEMRVNYLKKKNRARFLSLHKECLDSDISWIHSDVRFSVEHREVSRRRAKAWLALISYLNKAFVWPFKVPCNL